MQSTPQETLTHAMIFVSKFDQDKDLKLTSKELRLSGIKRTHRSDDTIHQNVSEQVKYLKEGLADLFQKPKYIGVGLLKKVNTTLQNEGISTYNNEENLILNLLTEKNQMKNQTMKNQTTKKRTLIRKKVTRV
jgi:hypothetical protein